jgi:hypothetical protein
MASALNCSHAELYGSIKIVDDVLDVVVLASIR